MPDHEIDRRLCSIEEHLQKIERMLIHHQEKIMATLQDIKDEVAAEKTIVDSVVTLVQDLAAKVAALQPNQADIDQLAADIKAQSDALAAAVIANTGPTARPK